jgi:hypothetical protein
LFIAEVLGFRFGCDPLAFFLGEGGAAADDDVVDAIEASEPRRALLLLFAISKGISSSGSFDYGGSGGTIQRLCGDKEEAMYFYAVTKSCFQKGGLCLWVRVFWKKGQIRFTPRRSWQT